MKEILNTKDLNVSYGNVQILKNINISVNSGEILVIVGESGSGKSTLLKSLIKLAGNGSKIDSGSIKFKDKDLTKLSNEELRLIRGKEIATIFQNTGASLCPIRTIEKQFLETVKTHENATDEEIKKRISEIFTKINLKDVDRILKSYPFELSGGMNQRVGIALAMITNPSLILADEPTSALDVTAQAQVVKTLMKLRDDFKTSIIMITHNMGVVSYMADKVAVMYGGNIVEYGRKKDIIHRPLHPYTKMLIKSTPDMKKSISECFTETPSTVNYENRIVNCHLYKKVTAEEKVL